MALNVPLTVMSKWPLFVKFGLTKKMIYQEMGVSARNGNGLVETPILSATNVEAVLDSVNKYAWLLRDDVTVLAIDFVAILPAMVLPVEPKIDDIMIAESLTQFKVKGVLPDPASAHYEIWIRPIKTIT